MYCSSVMDNFHLKEEIIDDVPDLTHESPITVKKEFREENNEIETHHTEEFHDDIKPKDEGEIWSEAWIVKKEKEDDPMIGDTVIPNEATTVTDEVIDNYIEVTYGNGQENPCDQMKEESSWNAAAWLLREESKIDEQNVSEDKNSNTVIGAMPGSQIRIVTFHNNNPPANDDTKKSNMLPKGTWNPPLVSTLTSENSKTSTDNSENVVLYSQIAPYWNSSHKNEFSCYFCGKVFPLLSELNMHKILHGQENIHKRVRIENVTSSGDEVRLNNDNLRLRSLLENTPVNQPSKDQLIGKTCSEVKQEKIFRCIICGRSFRKKMHFDSHSTVHTRETEERKYQCHLCENRFHSKHSLKYHIDTHVTIRKFTCDICGQLFKQHRTMREHTVTLHSKEKTFKCNICNRFFPRRYHLNNHVRNSHSRENKSEEISH